MGKTRAYHPQTSGRLLDFGAGRGCTKGLVRRLARVFLFMLLALPGRANADLPVYTPLFHIDLGRYVPGADYSSHRLNWGDADAPYAFSVQNRLQPRFVSPYDADPRTLESLRLDDGDLFFRRVRTKVRGNLNTSRLTYFVQYDWLDGFTRDVGLNYRWGDRLNLWAGRGKVMYNDERVVSSGRVQFVNRSIVSDLFSLDRQMGLQLHGRLFPATAANVDYALGFFAGQGLGARSNEADRPMLTARLRWNVLGERISRQQSDHAFTPRPGARITLGGMSGRSSCTRFVSQPESCLALPGFITPNDAGNGQFEMRQFLLEGKFNWQGISVLSELHWKEVVDRTLGLDDPRRQTALRGGFLQGGIMLQRLSPGLPPRVEAAMRYAYIDPDDPRGSDDQREISAVINWFIDGHENKISAEIAHLTVGDPALQESDSRYRFRLQWELRF